jgi:hypothetical protein
MSAKTPDFQATTNPVWLEIKNGVRPSEQKQPWQQPVIEYVNLAWSEADGGATFDGAAGSS